MRAAHRQAEAGFTLVELTIVVVISTIALIAIYQTLITQERTYRYQSAAIDAQGSSRIGLQILASELREISASAGDNATATQGSDLLAAGRDSIRFRAFRKAGVTCAVDRVLGTLDVWYLGSAFAAGDTLLLFQENDINADEDDTWTQIVLPAIGTSLNAAACRAEWGTYPVQALRSLLPTSVTGVQPGALVRSFETITYGAYRYEDEWVLGRRNSDGSIAPLVGPLLSPDEGGLQFRYFDVFSNELTPTTAALRAQVSRVEITVRALSRGGLEGAYVDSLTTNVYLRGN